MVKKAQLEEEFSVLEKITPVLLERADYQKSLHNCIEDAFKIKENVSSKLIDNTQSIAHCYFLSPNRNNSSSCYEDLAQLLIDNLIEYVIPRSEINSLSAHDTAGFQKLHRKARRKFVDYWKAKKQLVEKGELDPKKLKSGEAGEVLLFLLAEQILNFPQAICKTNLKTNSNMHVHGSDGIHIGLSEDKNKLALYYGEAKLYQDINSAISNALESLKPLLQKENDEDDLDLLTSYSDFGVTEDAIKLKQLLKDYFDPEHRKNKFFTDIRGICLIGFDETSVYQTLNNDEIANVVLRKSSNWIERYKDNVSKNKLEQIIINVFFIPMESVELFRTSFAQKLEGSNDSDL